MSNPEINNDEQLALLSQVERLTRSLPCPKDKRRLDLVSVAFHSKPKLVVWHDMQIDGVAKAVEEIARRHRIYSFYRVANTGMAFALPVISHRR